MCDLTCVFLIFLGMFQILELLNQFLYRVFVQLSDHKTQLLVFHIYLTATETVKCYKTINKAKNFYLYNILNKILLRSTEWTVALLQDQKFKIFRMKQL